MIFGGSHGGEETENTSRRPARMGMFQQYDSLVAKRERQRKAEEEKLLSEEQSMPGTWPVWSVAKEAEEEEKKREYGRGWGY